MRVINERRSVRKFKAGKIPCEDLGLILRAGMQAPSTINSQPWEYIVVRDEKVINELSKMNSQVKFISNAGAIIVPVFDKSKVRKGLMEYIKIDMSLTVENMLLEAAYLDLGSVMIGVYSETNKMEIVADALNLPNNIVPFCLLPIGQLDNENANHFIDRFDETKIHLDKY